MVAERFMRRVLSIKKLNKRSTRREKTINSILFQSQVLGQTVFVVALSKNLFILNNFNSHFADVIEDKMACFDNDGFITQALFPEDVCRYRSIVDILYEFYITKQYDNEDMYYFSFYMNMQKKDGTSVNCSFKVMPLFFIHLKKKKAPGFAYCQLEKSDSDFSGQLILHDFSQNKKYYYLLLENTKNTNKMSYLVFDEKELAVFRLSAQGYVESEIAELLGISFGTLKYLKTKYLFQANVQSTAQLIMLLCNQGFI